MSISFFTDDHDTNCDYIVHVKTSDIFGAGTDANVSIQLIGEKGVSDVINLKRSQYRNKFERNQLDKFLFYNTPSMGKLKELVIWHDNSGIGPDWHLEYVEICDTSLGQIFRFPCHRWLHINREGINTIIHHIKCLEIMTGPKKTIQKAEGVPRKFTDAKPAQDDLSDLSFSK